MGFNGIAAVIFDAYGTLFDVHGPAQRLATRIGPQADALSRLWRQKQVEYTWLRSLMRAQPLPHAACAPQFSQTAPPPCSARP